MNYNRMTIRESSKGHQVFKMSPSHQHAGAVSGGGFRKTIFTVRALAQPRFTGTYSECVEFIQENGAEFMSEHEIPV